MLTLTPAVEAALTSGNHVEVVLLEMRFSSANTLYMSNASIDIDWSGATYSANGLFIGMDSIKSESKLNAIETPLTFSAADQSIIAIILNEEQLNREVIVHRAIIDPTNGQVIPDPINMGTFLISGTAINDAERGIVTITVASFWSDFERRNGIATTHDSIRRVYPAETGLINSKDIKQDLKWGGE